MRPGWTETRYPGDSARVVVMRRGDEIGDVRIQVYSENDPDAACKVATFLPGREVFLPGDTPKVEPEEWQWCCADAADYYLAAFVHNAKLDGWVEQEVKR